MLEASDHEPDREHNHQHERSGQRTRRPKQITPAKVSTTVSAPMRTASADDNAGLSSLASRRCQIVTPRLPNATIAVNPAKLFIYRTLVGSIIFVSFARPVPICAVVLTRVSSYRFSLYRVVDASRRVSMGCGAP